MWLVFSALIQLPGLGHVGEYRFVTFWQMWYLLFSVCMILMIICALLPKSLSHRTITQKVVGLIPDGAIRVYLLLAMGSVQPLNRNEYRVYLLEVIGGWCIGLATLPPSFADCLEILGLTSQNPKSLSRPV